MKNIFANIFKKYVVEKQDDRSLIIAVNSFLIVFASLYVIGKSGPFTTIRLILLFVIIIEIIAMFFAVRNILQPARVTISILGFITVTILISIGGVHDDAIGGYYCLLILNTLFFGRKGLFISGLANTTAILVIGLAETSGLITTHFGPLSDVLTVVTTAFFMLLSTLVLSFFISRLTQMIETARTNEQYQIKANLDLTELKIALEQRVKDRTSDLQAMNLKQKVQLTEIKKLQAKLLEESIRDPLTGLYNRRFMNENLALEIARAKRTNSPITIFFLDIDHFKEFNDNYGHQMGDAILVEIAKVLQTGLRAGDFICRYGGEEFVMVLPGMPNDKAKNRAERILVEVKKILIPNQDGKMNITVSIGIASFPQDATLIDELIKAADKALYFAKLKGRDRVELIHQN